MGRRTLKDMNVTSAEYLRDKDNTQNAGIKATIDGVEMFIPLDPANTHYADLMNLVEAGELEILDNSGGE